MDFALKQVLILTIILGTILVIISENRNPVKTIDDSLVTIGSTNIDFRGFEQDFEITAFMYDESLAVQQRDIFLDDQKDAELIDPLEWDKRPRIDKAKESVARIFSPVL